MCPSFLSQFDALSWKKAVSCEIQFFCYLIQSVLSKFHEILWLYCLLAASACSLVLLSLQNYITGKGCLMSVTYVFFFFFSHFPFSFRLFKIYVVDQKPQTMISFFFIYTKLCYSKRGPNDKLKRKLCNVESLWL